MLHAVGHIGRQEPAVGVGQEVVDRVATRDGAVALDSVDVVVSRAGTEFRFQQASGNKHQARRNNQLVRTGSDQQTALIRPRRDLNDCRLKGGFIQVSASGRAVAVGAARNQRVGGAEQGHAVARLVAVEAVVQREGSLDLLRVRHGASERLGVTSRQAVIQVIFHRLFGDGEAIRDGFMRITSGPGFLAVVICNRLTFVLHGGSSETRQLDFFFKGTLRVFSLVDFLMLLSVPLVLQTEQRVQARKQFFEKLCATNSHGSQPPYAMTLPVVVRIKCVLIRTITSVKASPTVLVVEFTKSTTRIGRVAVSAALARLRLKPELMLAEELPATVWIRPQFEPR